MAGVATEESGAGRPYEGESDGQLQQQACQSGDALAEWRSSEQVENGTPSTSPPYWDSDDDGDRGPKPSELYGRYTWKIEKFSQISKRELRSNAFEIGGYKWYVLIYPQGCDVCNHLSLFLCVANHDKLLPGWGHFAQFTICVVNKDPKKSKYSDTLHRFWKKEHDWGWKKFMELSKLLDGFIDADTLIIKAQVQVIRERAEQPFRCLDRQYRRELVRVYLTNVEQICRRFVEERRVKLGKLIDDKVKWSSFCAFWLSMDQSSRRHLSREKTESILKIVVKHFFIEKEVTSTLVMDSLYSGLKFLKGHHKGKKSKMINLETEESSVPIVRIEKDMFVLVDDVMPLVERAATEPLPPKDDKGPQNRTKDAMAGEEFNKDPIELDERKLTELGRRTIEIFVLAHIFSSKIEVAYQEAVALKRQEELIREEEEAWLAEIVQKAQRGATDKEKKSKKKQGKQKRNNRKGKDKGKDDKASINALGKTEQDTQSVGEKDFITADPETVPEKSDAVDDVSDASDTVSCVPEIIPPDSDDRDAPINWDTDTSEVHPPTETSSSGISGLSSVRNGTEGRSSSVLDDSSSTCSSDSFLSLAINASYRGNSQHCKDKKSPRRSRNHRGKVTSDPANWVNGEPSHPSELVPDTAHSVEAPQHSTAVDCLSLKRTVNVSEQKIQEKEEDTGSKHRNFRASEVSGDRTACAIWPPRRSSGNIPSIAPSKMVSKANAASDLPMVEQSSLNGPKQGGNKSAHLAYSAEKSAISKPEMQKLAMPKPTTTKPSGHQGHVGNDKPPAQPTTSTTDKSSMPPMPVMSRPLSAPLVLGPRHPVPIVSTFQTRPILARSASAAGRLGPESTASATQSSIPQSYRNAIIGNHATGSLPAYTQSQSSSSLLNASIVYSQALPNASAPPFSPHRSDRVDANNGKPSFTFGMVNHGMLPNRPLLEFPQRDGGRNLSGDRASLHNDVQSFEMFRPVHARSLDPLTYGFAGRASSHQSHVLADEFPHLDIINDLLDDEHASNSGHQSFINGQDYLSQQFSFLSDPGRSAVPGLSANAGRLDKTPSHHESLQLGSGTSYDTIRGMTPQASPQSYMNGHINCLIPTQWQMTGTDLPFPNVRNSDNNGYPYYIPEYQSLAGSTNGYRVFHPSNGL